MKEDFFRGYTEYHCHLLYGVDDGSSSWEDTSAMLQAYEDLGVKDIWLTPHVMEDFPNTTQHLRGRFAELCDRYKGPIRLHLAAEYMICPVLEERIASKDLLTLGSKSMHVLVETSYYDAPIQLDRTLDQLLSAGYVPVMAHPERSEYMTDKMMQSMYDKGVKFQLDLFSLCDAYSPSARLRAEKYLKQGYYALSGMDTHSLRFLKCFSRMSLSAKVYGLIPGQPEVL